MTKSKTLALAAAVGFIGTILAANHATTEYGFVSVGFGLTATAGTYFAGLAFVLRDAVQDTAGKWAVMALIVVGAGLSWLIAAPFIALASGCAFLLSEAADLTIYSPLREHGYVRAAVASNAVGTVVDTVVFLWIAGFPLWAALPGQLVGKLMVTAVLVAGVLLVRGARQVRSA